MELVKAFFMTVKYFIKRRRNNMCKNTTSLVIKTMGIGLVIGAAMGIAGERMMYPKKKSKKKFEKGIEAVYSLVRDCMG